MTTRLIQRLLGPGLALLAILVLVPAALAQGPQGRLQVDGVGTVTADGNFALLGAVSARKGETLRIIDRAGDAKVDVNGQSVSPQSQRGQREFRVRGGAQFLISGTAISVVVQGGSVTVSIAGTGVVRLRGSGTYALDGATAQPWTSAKIQVGGMAAPSKVKRSNDGRPARAQQPPSPVEP